MQEIAESNSTTKKIHSLLEVMQPQKKNQSVVEMSSATENKSSVQKLRPCRVNFGHREKISDLFRRLQPKKN